MEIIKNFLAFIIGLILLLLFYYYVSIPIIPCISVYATSNLFANNSIKSRVFLIIIISLIGIYFYTANAILSIVHYPKYLNIFGIILEFITVFSFLTACITLVKAWKKSKIYIDLEQ